MPTINLGINLSALALIFSIPSSSAASRLATAAKPIAASTFNNLRQCDRLPKLAVIATFLALAAPNFDDLIDRNLAWVFPL
mmetsp:Transcript_367/g.738  ORF Transcript_367/g.738 Transcript_367/m.738 type:complete len:81 (-) Transcript_367:64-306(-)